MRFFNRYPKVPYTFGTLKSESDFTNLSVYADLIDSIKDDSSLYRLIDVRDNERPDLLADRLYSDSSLGWTLAFMNESHRTGSWPLGYNDFQDHINEEMPGQFVCVNETETSPDTGAEILSMTSRFAIGSTVYGTISGAIGTVYARNANRAHIFVDVSSGAFIADETIQNVIAPATPSEFLTTSAVGIAHQATHHYEDGDGEIVDVDPTGSVPAEYTPITYEQMYERKNAELSRVRVLREDVANQVSIRYRDIIDS